MSKSLMATPLPQRNGGTGDLQQTVRYAEHLIYAALTILSQLSSSGVLGACMPMTTHSLSRC